MKTYLVSCLLLFSLLGCGKSDGPDTSGQNFGGITPLNPGKLTLESDLVNQDRFKTVIFLAKKAQFTDLKERSEMTFFAPTNAAFAKLSEEEIKFLLETASPNYLRKFLGSYLVKDQKELSPDEESVTLETLEFDKKIIVTYEEETGFKANQKEINIRFHSKSGNGIAYHTDNLLHPLVLVDDDGDSSYPISTIEYLKKQNGLSLFYKALVKHKLLRELTDDVTVFAPMDSGFDQMTETDRVKALSKESLLRHLSNELLDSKKIKDLRRFEARSGERVEINIDSSKGNEVRLNQKSIIRTFDTRLEDGIIHRVNVPIVVNE